MYNAFTCYKVITLHYPGSKSMALLADFLTFGNFSIVQFAHSTSPRAYFDFAVLSIDKKK